MFLRATVGHDVRDIGRYAISLDIYNHRGSTAAAGVYIDFSPATDQIAHVRRFADRYLRSACESSRRSAARSCTFYSLDLLELPSGMFEVSKVL
jgi:hypothetical protein